MTSNNAGGYALVNDNNGILYDYNSGSAFLYARNDGNDNIQNQNAPDATGGINHGEYRGTINNLTSGLGGEAIHALIPLPTSVIKGKNLNAVGQTVNISIPSGNFICTGNFNTDSTACQGNLFHFIFAGEKAANGGWY